MVISKLASKKPDFPDDRLKGILQNLPQIVIAFSGGIDSRFLCHAAFLCGCDILAIHAEAPHIPISDSQNVILWLKNRNIKYKTFYFDPLNIPAIASNSLERCYFCKKMMLSTLHNILLDSHENNRIICDGMNADDLNAFRPGSKASKEFGIRSPLSEAGLNKNNIRNLARLTELDNPEQHQRTCLLTRLAYGLKPNKKTLHSLQQAENDIEQLINTINPLCDFRLRLTPSPILQLTINNPKIINTAKILLEKYGFYNCKISISNSISGFFDK